MNPTTPVNTPERSGSYYENQPVEASAILYAGSLAASNAAGNVVPASDSENLKVLGRVESDSLNSVFDNSQGAAGDLVATIKRGCFVFANSTANPVTQASIGQTIFVEDAKTVASQSSNHIPAGVFLGFEDGDPAWVIVDTRES